MAYENMTYPFLVDRMLQRISDYDQTIDTREGSIVFNAIADTAMELAIAYVEMNNVLNESFVATASRQYILMGCRQAGMDITQFEASHGIHEGVFNVPVPIGSRWNYDIYNFTVLEQITDPNWPTMYVYTMECETAGSEPNIVAGDLTPIDETPQGLTFSKVLGCLILGEDEATDEEMREIYQDFVDNSVSDGNVAQYRLWCNEYDGIGNHKIFPRWNGVNTVKVSILDTDNGIATSQLISEFQDYLDPPTAEIDDSDVEAPDYPQGRGMGNGVAPIGAIVTVDTATAKTINIGCDVTFKAGYSDVTTLTDALNDYLNGLAYERSSVSYLGVGAVLYSVEGVDAISNLTLNDGEDDITVADEEIAVLGDTDWRVTA